MSKKEYRLITYNCFDCGFEIKIFIIDNKIKISILDKPYTLKDIITNLGYYVCISCKKKQPLKFEYVYK